MTRSDLSRRHLRRHRRCSGAVAAEVAVTLPILVAVALALTWALAAGALAVQAQDAAREAARLAARGEGEAAVARAQDVAPSGAQVSIHRSDGLVTVAVSVDLPGPDLLDWVLPLSRVERHATAAEEVP